MPERAHAKDTTRLVATWGAFVAVSSVLISLAGWLLTEPGLQVVLHRGLDGQPTRIGSVTEPLIVMPLVTIGMLALMLAIARWGHHLRYDDQPLPPPRALAATLVGCCALMPVLQTLMLADALDLLAWEQTQTLVELVVAVPLLALGAAMRHPALAPKFVAYVNVPMPLDPARRARIVRATSTFLIALGGIGSLAALFAPSWVFIAVVGPGATVGVVALLAAVLRLQEQEYQTRDC